MKISQVSADRLHLAKDAFWDVVSSVRCGFRSFPDAVDILPVPAVSVKSIFLLHGLLVRRESPARLSKEYSLLPSRI